MSDHVQKYRNLYQDYALFASRTESLLVELLRLAPIKVHFTESRAKSVASFAEKTNRPGKSFANPIEEMPDLAGVRVVLYYLDDVSRVGDLISREFETLERVSSHQPDGYSADTFGYLSMHYIVRLNDTRRTLPEWSNFAAFRAEIQVRTVLQHSWAAISHALQYKREGDVPFRLRRRLYRLAGLFELADEEFIGLRDAKEDITTRTEQKSGQDLQYVRLDAPVIRKFLATSEEMKNVIKVMETVGFDFSDDVHNEPREEFIGQVVEECERLGIQNLEMLVKAISYDHLTFFSAILDTKWFTSDSFALWLLLIGAFPEKFDVDYLVAKGWSASVAEELMQRIPKTSD